MPTFSPPVERRPLAKPFQRWKYDRGRTVYKKNSVWHEVSDPSWEEIATADVVAVANRPGGERTDGTNQDRYLFLGGREYTISTAVGTELVAAGFTVVGMPGGGGGPDAGYAVGYAGGY